MCTDKAKIEFHCVSSREGHPLNIFTRLWYRISLKSIPNGMFTFENDQRGKEGNYIQLALNDLDDFSTPQGTFYQKGLWTICAEPKSKENEYTLIVMANPSGKLTYTVGSSWGGRYMEIDNNHSENYQPGGNMHSSALWFFKASELPDYYTIHNCDPRRDPNFMTFSNEESEKGQLVQIATKDVHLYQPNGSFRQDALWTFVPQLYELSAYVTNFEFEMLTDSEIEDVTYPVRLTTLEISEANSGSIKYSTEIPESFKLSFMQSFKPFNDNVIIDVDNISKKIKVLKEKQLKFERKMNSNTQFVCNTSNIYSIKETLAYSNTNTPPDKEMKIGVYSNLIKDMEIPFNADVLIRAKAQISDPYEDDNLTSSSILDLRVIKYLLKVERFTGKFSDLKSTTKSTTENQEYIICKVTGKFNFTATKNMFCRL